MFNGFGTNQWYDSSRMKLYRQIFKQLKVLYGVSKYLIFKIENSRFLREFAY